MATHKSPYRFGNDVAQSYEDGVVMIYGVTDSAAAGMLPQETLSIKARLDYQERKLGIKRYYEAAQNQRQIERVIRVPAPTVEIHNQDAAITEDGRAYRIDLVQVVTDVWPRSLDLTLAAYRQGQAAGEPMRAE